MINFRIIKLPVLLDAEQGVYKLRFRKGNGLFNTELLSRKFLKEAREKIRLPVIAIACCYLITEKEGDCPQTAQTNHCVNDTADNRRLTAENGAD